MIELEDRPRPAHAHVYAQAPGSKYYEVREHRFCSRCGRTLVSRQSQKTGVCGMCERFPPPPRAPEVLVADAPVRVATAYSPAAVEE